jgi:threonine synthase
LGIFLPGYVAKKMGLPIDKLIIATNQNDILDRVIKTGIYKIEDVKPSISPSMDIQVSSNFERALFDIFDNDPVLVRRLMNNLQSAKEFKLNSSEIKKLQDIFESGSSSEEETNTTMRAVYKESGIVLCPHSATGVKIALENNNDKDTPMVVLATADPAKFPDAVANACGIKPELPDRMKDLFERTEMFQKVPNDISHIKEAITKGVNE